MRAVLMTRYLALFCCAVWLLSGSPAIAVTSNDFTSGKTDSQKALTESLIVGVDHIDDHYLYTDDGRRFEIDDRTRIHRRPGSWKKSPKAVLFFRQGQLRSVIIKSR
jgi:hypothetical protein